MMEFQMGGMLEKWRYGVIDREFYGPGAHDIPEVSHWYQINQKDRRNKSLREAYSVTPGVRVRIKVHK